MGITYAPRLLVVRGRMALGFALWYGVTHIDGSYDLPQNVE